MTPHDCINLPGSNNTQILNLHHQLWGVRSNGDPQGLVRGDKVVSRSKLILLPRPGRLVHPLGPCHQFVESAFRFFATRIQVKQLRHHGHATQRD